MSSQAFADGVAHLHGRNRFFAAAGEIGGAQAGGERGFDRSLNGVGRLVFLERVAEHERGGQNLRDGIGDALARDVGCGTAARLVEAEGAVGQGRAGQESKRADRRGRLVADDVAEEIFAEHDVELLRLADELHRGVVDIHEVERDVGILRREGLDRLAPEDARLEHIRLVDQRDPFAAQLRGLEGDVGDPFDFLRIVDHRVDGALAALDGNGLLGLAEIESAGQFAHHQHVETVGDEFGLDRREVEEAGITFRGAQVGVEAEMFAQGQQRGALRLLVRRQAFPFRAADGAEENRLGRAATFERGGRQGGVKLVDGGAADGVVLRLDLETETFRGGVEDVEADSHDFGPNAVTGEDGDFVGVAHKL
jgi:hypothetical protein